MDKPAGRIKTKPHTLRELKGVLKAVVHVKTKRPPRLNKYAKDIKATTEDQLVVAALLMGQVNTRVADKYALWDVAQNEAETAYPTPTKLRKIAQSFTVMADRLRERASDIEAEKPPKKVRYWARLPKETQNSGRKRGSIEI